MKLLGPKKPVAPADENPPARISVRLPQSLISKMEAYHKPKEKSAWIAEALEDLLARETYKTANWSEPNEATEVFLAMLSLNERMKDPQPDVIILPSGVNKALATAVSNISRLGLENSKSLRPALIRAAIRQRLVLGGRRWSNVAIPDLDID